MAGANDFFVEDFFPDEVPGVPGFRRLTESTPEMNVYRPMTPEDLAVCKNRCPKGREMAAKMGLASGSGLGQKKDRAELITDSYGQKGKLGLGFLLPEERCGFYPSKSAEITPETRFTFNFFPDNASIEGIKASMVLRYIRDMQESMPPTERFLVFINEGKFAQSLHVDLIVYHQLGGIDTLTSVDPPEYAREKLEAFVRGETRGLLVDNYGIWKIAETKLVTKIFNLDFPCTHFENQHSQHCDMNAFFRHLECAPRGQLQTVVTNVLKSDLAHGRDLARFFLLKEYQIPPSMARFVREGESWRASINERVLMG